MPPHVPFTPIPKHVAQIPQDIEDDFRRFHASAAPSAAEAYQAFGSAANNANAKRDERLEITDTLAERGKRYGDFALGSILASGLKRSMRNHPSFGALQAGHQQALDIIMDKVSRIINGDPMYADNWHDIAGYATLGEQMCRKD